MKITKIILYLILLSYRFIGYSENEELFNDIAKNLVTIVSLSESSDLIIPNKGSLLLSSDYNKSINNSTNNIDTLILDFDNINFIPNSTTDDIENLESRRTRYYMGDVVQAEEEVYSMIEQVNIEIERINNFISSSINITINDENLKSITIPAKND